MRTEIKEEYLTVIQNEERASFDFFWKEANTDEHSPSYGLIRDNTSDQARQMASIASVGYGLAAIPIGVERGWISYEDGYERVLGTLKTFWNHAEHYEGFFYHFLDMDTAKKFDQNYDCVSIIDTTLFLNGAIVAGEYFGGSIKELVIKLYERVNWTIYYNEEINKFYMGYDPEKGGFGEWGTYAEQLSVYILAVGSPTYPVPAKVYEGFDRYRVSYGDYSFSTCPGNPLFIHQYSHAWYNFQNQVDNEGNDWFENSVQATLAQRQYAIDNPQKFTTFHEKSWGLTACQGPFGYIAYGAAPFAKGSDGERNDGTIAPSAAAGSIVFAPQEVLETLHYFYTEIPELWGEYGFKDSYNLDIEPHWYADREIGIDKGITILMIENYLTGMVWNLYMKNHFVQLGAEKIGFKKN